MEISSINARAMMVPMDLAQNQTSSSSKASDVKKVSQQFEAILMRQFLSKSVSSMMDSENSPSGDVYGYFLTDVLSQKLAEGGGLGVGKVLERQLSPAGMSASNGPAQANVKS